MEVVHSSDFDTTRNLHFYPYECSTPLADPFPPSQNFPLCAPECHSSLFTSFPTSAPRLKSSSALGTASRSSAGFPSRHLTSRLPWTPGSRRWPLHCSFPTSCSHWQCSPWGSLYWGESPPTTLQSHSPHFPVLPIIHRPFSTPTMNFSVFPWITHITSWPLDSSFPNTTSATVSLVQHLDCSISEIIHADFLLSERVRLSSQHSQ